MKESTPSHSLMKWTNLGYGTHKPWNIVVVESYALNDMNSFSNESTVALFSMYCSHDLQPGWLSQFLEKIATYLK